MTRNSKTMAIRQVATINPAATPREIVATLAIRGVRVSLRHVQIVCAGRPRSSGYYTERVRRLAAVLEA